jgi:hypothetical protein
VDRSGRAFDELTEELQTQDWVTVMTTRYYDPESKQCLINVANVSYVVDNAR